MVEHPLRPLRRPIPSPLRNGHPSAAPLPTSRDVITIETFIDGSPGKTGRCHPCSSPRFRTSQRGPYPGSRTAAHGFRTSFTRH